MKLVAVTACSTGIAHTYMAQEALVLECEKRGHEIKVETQGGLGIENELSQKEINAADAVILAIAVAIEGSERFEEKEDEGKVIKMDPGAVIRNVAEVIDRVEKL